MSEDNKIVRGFLQGKRWKYITILLLIIIGIFAVLNIQTISENLPAIIIIIVIVGIAYYFLFKERPEPPMPDMIESLKIIEKKLGDYFEDITTFEKETTNFYVDRLNPLEFVIKINSIDKTFVFNRKKQSLEALKGTEDIDAYKQSFYKDELLQSAFAKGLAKEDAGSIVKKIIEGDGDK